MNERIRLLAEQAGFYVADGKIYIPSISEEITTCQEKFAELIVQECIDTVSDSSVEYCTRPQIVSEIKEHFGVEE